jgi:hypothetical protein
VGAPRKKQTLEVLVGGPLLHDRVAGCALRPAWCPHTRFERRGLALCHGASDLVFTRRF